MIERISTKLRELYRESKHRVTQIIERKSAVRSNAAYDRYAGEMEISRVDLPADPRMNIAGAVIDADRAFLPYLVRGMGIKLMRP